jgi:hypothetical protein
MSLVPMLLLVVPVGLAVAHLEYRFGYAGPAPGQPVLVKAQLREGAAMQQAVTLDAPPEVQVLTPAVWFPATGEVVWQVAAEAPGEYELRLRTGADVAVKTFSVGEGIARRSPVRAALSFASQLAYPAEPPLPEGLAVSSIRVAYDPASIRILGWNIPWMLAYFILTIVFAFPLRKPLKVAI